MENQFKPTYALRIVHKTTRGPTTFLLYRFLQTLICFFLTLPTPGCFVCCQDKHPYRACEPLQVQGGLHDPSKGEREEAQDRQGEGCHCPTQETGRYITKHVSLVCQSVGAGVSCATMMNAIYIAYLLLKTLMLKVEVTELYKLFINDDVLEEQYWLGNPGKDGVFLHFKCFDHYGIV